jgi:hypothetical protein
MSSSNKYSHLVSTAGWGALLVWWGVSLAIDPITLGMCAIGTGLIMLAANTARMLKGVRPVRSTTVIGIIALAWGALDLARAVLGFAEGASFALLLVVIGLVTWVTLLFPQAAGQEAA